MDEARFWTIIGESYRPELLEQADALKITLNSLKWFEVLAFQAQFEAHVKAAATPMLRAAAQVINGDSSERGLRNFLLGLVALGQRAYDAALADADSLADFLDGELVDGYGLDKVAMRVYEEKTGGADFFEKLAELHPGQEPGPLPELPSNGTTLHQMLPRLSEMYASDEP